MPESHAKQRPRRLRCASLGTGLGNFLIALKDQRNHQRSGKRSWGKALSSLDLSRDAHDAVDWNPVKGLRPR
ncbi:MAG: hypothetical protein ACO3JV_10755, partial [Pseudomonadales bacterium]